MYSDLGGRVLDVVVEWGGGGRTMDEEEVVEGGTEGILF